MRAHHSRHSSRNANILCAGMCAILRRKLSRDLRHRRAHTEFVLGTLAVYAAAVSVYGRSVMSRPTKQLKTVCV